MLNSKMQFSNSDNLVATQIKVINNVKAKEIVGNHI